MVHIWIHQKNFFNVNKANSIEVTESGDQSPKEKKEKNMNLFPLLKISKKL